MKNEELTYEEIIGKIVNSKVFIKYYVDPVTLFDHSIYDRPDYDPSMIAREQRWPRIKAIMVLGKNKQEFIDELGGDLFIENHKTIQDCL